jgi:hypothetical protein
MIKFKLTRDQARLIEREWISFMIMNAASAVHSNAGIDNKFLSSKIVLSLLLDVQLMFKKKLLNSTNNLSFSLSIAHAAAFYVYLMKRPIDAENVWAINMRQKLCDELYKELFADRPPAHEGVPLSWADFEFAD